MMLPKDLPVRSTMRAVNGTRLHVVEPVDNGKGELIVLLHGFPETWWTWRYQIAPLAAAGYRVVCPDLRGYGASDLHGPFDIDTLAGDVAALITELGKETGKETGQEKEQQKAIVIGHDWGGAIAWHLAATMPERCKRLIVVSCPHPQLLARGIDKAVTSLDARQLKKSWYMFAFQIPRFAERMLTRGRGDALRKIFRGHTMDRAHFSDAETQPFVDAILQPGRASAMLGYYRAAFATRLRGGHRPLRVIDTPTLLLWAKHDRAFERDLVVPGTERLATKLEVRDIDAGHFAQVEKPGVITDAILGFLRPN